MEVHHPHVVKKNFKEYFLEFLMIFLAVTMGFFAENVREHFTEKTKGKEYIKSFLEDLSSDTAQYNKIIVEFTKRDAALQNMDNCFDSLNKDMKITAGLLNIVRNSGGFTDLIYTDRTIRQIKSAGGLYLIQNKEIENHILQYDAAVRSDLIRQETMEKVQTQTMNAHISMIGYKEFNSLRRNNIPTTQLNYLGVEIKQEGNKDVVTFLSSWYYPLQVEQENVEPLIRTAMFANREDRSLICSGNVPQGSKIKFSPPPDFDSIEK